MIRQRPVRGESHLDFLEKSEGSLPQPHDSFQDAGEANNDFSSMSGNFLYRHHVEPRVKLYSLKKELFPFPLKYIDVTRTTRTNLDVKQEKRIDDYWNVDGSRDLSDPWTGFTQFTLLEEKPSDGYVWSGVRLTRQQLTSRKDHLWPKLWKSMVKHAKLKEKQKWSEEKSHLENARKLRRIHFIDPEDEEFKETIKNARKKLETTVAPAMPCKFLKNCGSGTSNKLQTKFACVLKADESSRMRMVNSVPHHHEDHIAGKGENSLQHYNLVQKFFPMPQATKIPAASIVNVLVLFRSTLFLELICRVVFFATLFLPVLVTVWPALPDVEVRDFFVFYYIISQEVSARAVYNANAPMRQACFAL